MGAINVGPASFYAGSVVSRSDDLLRAAERMVAEGAVLLDIGARSTAPYLSDLTTRLGPPLTMPNVSLDQALALMQATAQPAPTPEESVHG